MNDAERYAKRRLAKLTLDVAGCLTWATLDAMLADFERHPPHPMPEDLRIFVADMARQRAVLEAVDDIDRGISLRRIKDRLDWLENEARRKNA